MSEETGAGRKRSKEKKSMRIRLEYCEAISQSLPTYRERSLNVDKFTMVKIE